MLLDEGHQVTGLDIDERLLKRLERLYGVNRNFTSVKADATAGHLDGLPGAPFKTVLCLNVLEHFEDDRGTLRHFHNSLAAGGRVVIVVPALPALYGSMDAMFGHVRRYRRSELTATLWETGFSPQTSWFNMMGIFGWWWRFRILKKKQFSSWQNRVYDGVMPLMRAMEERYPPPVGLSLIAVGEKI